MIGSTSSKRRTTANLVRELKDFKSAMNKQVTINIGNYTSVSYILELLAQHGVDPKDAEIEVETYQEQNSYGTVSVSTEVYLKFQTRP